MASSSSKSNVLITVVLLALLAGGAAAYKFWPRSAEEKPGPKEIEGRNRVPGSAVSYDEGSPLPEGQVVELPFIFWGGDVATFHANGGLETKPDSIFGKHQLNLKLVPGDDFDQQVDNYLKNKSPFLRGTLSMLGQASDKLTAKAETTPVVFLQLTWSAGDHMVARAPFKSLNDLKGKKIALQKGGPHVGMLNDILRTVKLAWKDITVVWTEDVSGDKGPTSLFQKDPSIDACFAISPDMVTLTGGLTSKGTGEKGSVKGAHVLVSTEFMSRSIADVYAVRKDFFDKHRGWVQKLAAGYLKGCEELVNVKKQATAGEADGKARYKAIINLAQSVWGQDKAFKDSVKEEADVDGLISDATFVGLPGNESFFTNKGNLSGFPFKQQQALALPPDPAMEPFKTSPKPFLAPNFDYAALRKLGGLTGQSTNQPRFKVEIALDEPEQKIYTFLIKFEPNQEKFPEAQYGNDFQRALEQASLFGNAVIAVRGHTDAVNLLETFEKVGLAKGVLIKKDDKLVLKKDGSPIDLNDVKRVAELIKTEDFGTNELKEALQFFYDLSTKRAKSVHTAVTKFAAARGIRLDESQVRPIGLGPTEPVVAIPVKEEDNFKNRRVEFSIIRVPSDAFRKPDFDF